MPLRLKLADQATVVIVPRARSVPAIGLSGFDRSRRRFSDRIVLVVAVLVMIVPASMAAVRVAMTCRSAKAVRVTASLSGSFR